MVAARGFEQGIAALLPCLALYFGLLLRFDATAAAEIRRTGEKTDFPMARAVALGLGRSTVRITRVWTEALDRPPRRDLAGARFTSAHPLGHPGENLAHDLALLRCSGR